MISKYLIDTFHNDMNTQGYSILDTSRFIISKKWPTQRSPEFRKLNASKDGKYISLYDCTTDWIKELINWQDSLVKKALPEEFICRRTSHPLALRNENSCKNDKVCYWHEDGGFIRSICVVKGPTTQIKTPLGVSSIPLGWTLFLTAKIRSVKLNIPVTIHRRPRIEKPRRLIVFGWDGLKHREEFDERL